MTKIIFNELFAAVLEYWRYQGAAERVRALDKSAYDLWNQDRRNYFSMLRGKIKPDDIILLQEAFEQGLEGVRLLLAIRRPDLEDRVRGVPKERPNPMAYRRIHRVSDALPVRYRPKANL